MSKSLSSAFQPSPAAQPSSLLFLGILFLSVILALFLGSVLVLVMAFSSTSQFDIQNGGEVIAIASATVAFITIGLFLIVIPFVAFDRIVMPSRSSRSE